MRPPLVDWRRRELPNGARVEIVGAVRGAHELAEAIRSSVLRAEPRASVFVRDALEDDGRERRGRVAVVCHVTGAALGVPERSSAHRSAVVDVRRAVESACVGSVFPRERLHPG